MQTIELITHLNERIDLEHDSVDNEKLVLLSQAIVILESQVNADVLRMALVAPEVVGITERIPNINSVLSVKQIEIVQIGSVAQLSYTGSSGSQSQMTTHFVVSDFRGIHLNLFFCQRCFLQIDAIEMVHVVRVIHTAIYLKTIESAGREADVKGIVHVT